MKEKAVTAVGAIGGMAALQWAGDYLKSIPGLDPVTHALIFGAICCVGAIAAVILHFSEPPTTQGPK